VHTELVLKQTIPGMFLVAMMRTVAEWKWGGSDGSLLEVVGEEGECNAETGRRYDKIGREDRCGR